MTSQWGLPHPLRQREHWVDFALSVFGRHNKLSVFISMQNLLAGDCEGENMPFLENQTLSLLIAKTMVFCWREGQRKNKTKMCQQGSLGCFLC